MAKAIKHFDNLKHLIQSTSNEIVLPALIVVGASVVGTGVVGYGDVRSPSTRGFSMKFNR